METDGSQYSSCKGQLLVSEPSLADPNFRCTVVLVTEHDEKGAFGLIAVSYTHLTLPTKA